MRVLWNWEFWPYWLFYVPVYLAFPLFWLRTRSITFFSAVNESMRHGGLINYSKYDALRGIPPIYLPKTALLPDGVSVAAVESRMRELSIEFPVVLKPDRGERGYNVEIVRSRRDLEIYLAQSSDGLLLQEYIEADEEVGIMFCQIPEGEGGDITSIVHKVKMAVVGDGESTLEALIEGDPRCRYHRRWLYDDWKEKLDWVPRTGENIPLSKFGNHSRGAIFTDGGHLYSNVLRDTVKEIADGIEGFDVGRFDILIDSVEDLEAGNFKIIELNGVNSEPGHIYDPENTLFRAYRDLLVHWNTVSRVAKKNIDRGVKPDRLLDVMASMQQHFVRKKRLKVSLV